MPILRSSGLIVNLCNLENELFHGKVSEKRGIDVEFSVIAIQVREKSGRTDCLVKTLEGLSLPFYRGVHVNNLVLTPNIESQF